MNKQNKVSIVSPREIEREAKIVARQLLKRNGWIENLGNAQTEQKKWIIVSAKTSQKSKISPICSDLVKAMTTLNWLTCDPTGSLRLSAPGAEKLLNIDDGERFIAQHQDRQVRTIKDQAGRTVSVNFNETECPLGWMRARKDKNGKPLISQIQLEAGERIRRDFTIAQISPRVTASWEFSTPGGSKKARRGEGAMEISERALAAKQRFFAALDFLGTEMSGVVFEVCCLASGLEAAERQFNWPRRSAKLVLKIALTRLSEHYGFVQPDRDLHRPAVIRQWGRQGYQPVVPPSQQET